MLQKNITHTEKLNRRWYSLDSQEIWRRRWIHLWTARTSPSFKLDVWKIINGLFCSNMRALKWDMNHGKCSACHKNIETIEHKFYDNPRLRQLENIAEGTRLNKAVVCFFFGKMDTGIGSQKPQEAFSFSSIK